MHEHDEGSGALVDGDVQQGRRPEDPLQPAHGSRVRATNESRPSLGTAQRRPLPTVAA